ncbi:MAG: class I SAM-dependent methyltransferase, partial [Candidatus Adiutrix sp.]|nr:class I SAM-dependent methyltransferase [Candidatus Adiutrix sp.]
MIPDPTENIWEHSQSLRELYGRRARGEAEMDAAAQAAEILAPFIRSAAAAPRLLDAGCGSGYLFHSFKKRNLAVEYYGLDYSPSLIEIGRAILPAHGLPAERLTCGAIEDLRDRRFDLVALVNCLTFCPDFRAPLDRLMLCEPARIVIRDNFGPETVISWETDGYLDPGFNHLKAYWNRWSVAEVTDFLARGGYRSVLLEDRRVKGQAEMVVGKPYYWAWLAAER